VKITKQALIECLKCRFLDPGSSLIGESENKFPYLIFHKPTRKWCARFEGNTSVYFQTIEEARNILKDHILNGKKLPTKIDMMLSKGITKENLTQLYLKDNRSIDSISNQLGVSTNVLLYHLKKFKIERT
jgi:hypothetical protein